MFFEGRQCRLRITTGDAVELFGPGGYVGPDVPLPTGLLGVWMDLGLELEFVGVVWRAMVSRVVRVCFHYFTPGGEVQSDEVSGIYSLSRNVVDRDEELSLIYNGWP